MSESLTSNHARTGTAQACRDVSAIYTENLGPQEDMKLGQITVVASIV